MPDAVPQNSGAIDDKAELFEFMPQLGWSARKDGFIDYYNRGWYEYTGTTYLQIEGWGWTSVHDPEMLPSVLARWNESIAGGKTFEMEFPLRRHDGVFRWFLTRVNPIQNSSGQVERWVGINTDIDERHQAEIAAARLYDSVLNDMTEGVCVVRLQDGIVVHTNSKFDAMLGYEPGPLIGLPHLNLREGAREVPVDPLGNMTGWDLADAKGKPLERIFATSRNGNLSLLADGPFQGLEQDGVVALADQTFLYERDGGEVAIDGSRAPRKSPDGRVHGAVLVFRDLTAHVEAEEKKFRQQLVFSERITAVGTLAAGMAHEINNPLTYIAANVDSALEEINALAGGSPSGRMQDLVEMLMEARQGVSRVSKIVRGLKTFSRMEEQRTGLVDIFPVLELSINMAFHEIRHRARLVKDYAKLPLVDADDARLGQVFVNLIVNAAQSFLTGGPEDNEIRIVAYTDAEGRAVVEIRDNGPGIDPSLVERIFDPFFTTKPAGVGTGLGLAISHNIVTAMNGTMQHVASALRKGATFRVTLPPSLNALAAFPANIHSKPDKAKSVKVLVVDDEPAIGQAISRVLRNHAVTVLTSGQEALNILATGIDFDVVLSDLMMPGISGMQFYEMLLRQYPTIASKVVFMTCDGGKSED